MLKSVEKERSKLADQIKQEMAWKFDQYTNYTQKSKELQSELKQLKSQQSQLLKEKQDFYKIKQQTLSHSQAVAESKQKAE